MMRQSRNHPELPRIALGDRVVGVILTDLETLKKSKGRRQLEKCQYLVHFIAHELRKSQSSDNLLQTTAIWALINIFRINPDETRNIMLQAGIPGVLLNILRSGITGVSRQFASEICFFLSSNVPYPELKGDNRLNPLSQFPDIKVGNDISGQLEGDTGFLGQAAVSKQEELLPFVPYRINEANMAKLSTIFAKKSHRRGSEIDSISAIDDSLDDGDDGDGEDGSLDGMSLNSSDLSTRSGGSRQISNADMSSYRILTGGKYQFTSSHPLLQPKTNSRKNKNKRGQLAARIRTIAIQNERMAASMNSFTPFSLRDDHHSPRIEVSSTQKAGGPTIVTLAPMRSKASDSVEAMLGGFVDSGGDDEDEHGWHRDNDDDDALSVNSGLHSIKSDLSADPANLSHALLYGSGLELGGNRGGLIGSPNRVSSGGKKSRGSSRAESLHYTRDSRAGKVKGGGTSGGDVRANSAVDQLMGQLDALALEDTLQGSLHDATSDLVPKDEVDSRDAKRSSSGFRGSRGRHRIAAPFEGIAEQDGEEVDESMDDREEGEYAAEDEEGGEFNREYEDPDEDLQVAQPSPTKTMKINAETLLDLRFIRRLFNTKMSLKDSQSFINRLSDMLSLLDKDGTGYVSWHCFTKTILALAPPKLMKADVVAFMDAQTDNNEDLIDYEEFIISGKVLIVRKYGKPEGVLPVGAWLERQKLYAGDESTYTWKNHLKWYRKRKADAVVWLMRRATSAIMKCRHIEDCKRELYVIGARARAFSFLVETGFCAIRGEKNRLEAKRKLMARCLRAKRYVDVVNEAKRFLFYTARGVLALMNREDRDADVEVEPPRPRQADYANFYRLNYLRGSAQKWLAEKASHALVHWVRRVNTLDRLLFDGQKAVRQTIVQADARLILRDRAERARLYGIYKDGAALWLLRMGKRAYQVLEKLENTLKSLQTTGQRSLHFYNKKIEAESFLRKKGDFQLVRMNLRMQASKYILHRKKLALSLLQRQKEAIEYLHRIPVSSQEAESVIAFDHSWLLLRGKRALDHQLNQMKAFKRLKFVAGRAATIQRKTALAFLELQQMGKFTMLQVWEKQWLAQPGNKERLVSERARYVVSDKRLAESRASLSIEDRWGVEFADAFDWVAKFAPTPPQEYYEKPTDLTVSGLQRLTLKGKLLGVSKEYVEEGFRHMCMDGLGCVHKEDILAWFLSEAKKRHRRMLQKASRSKGFVFTLNDIVTHHERAVIALMRRFKGKVAKNYVDPDAIEDLYADAEQAPRRRRSNDDEEEEEEDEEGDEEGEEEDDENN